MILQVEHLAYGYNGTPVLRDVSFSLEAGRILGVLGVNGAGKTTLLKCLNRILRPQGGFVKLQGRSVSGMKRKEIATHFAYVPQRYGEEGMTVFDMILLGRKPYIRWEPTAADLRIVEALVHRLDLSALALRPVHQLSGGELQKVVIARALAQEAEVLLLDEPTSNLDLKNQIQVMELIASAVEEHALAAVVAIHDLNLAFRFADDFLLLKEGQVFWLGPKQQVTAAAIEAVYGLPVLLSTVDQWTVVIPHPDRRE